MGQGPTSPSAATDSANADWSSGCQWFDFNDLAHLNGYPPGFGDISPALLADGAPAETVTGAISPGQLLAVSRPPDPPTCAPSTTSAPASQRTGLGLNHPGDGCRCLTTLVAILERLGRYRLGDKPKAASNLDCLLFCLGSGVGACDKVLSCKACDACKENPILLATIAEQLACVCNDLCGCLLVHQHKVRSAANTGEPSAPGDPGGGDPQQPEADALVDGDISFGRYQIHGVEMRLRLIQNLLALHMTDFLALLDQMAQRTGRVDGAAGMLTDARKTAITANWMLQRLQSELHSKIHSAATGPTW